MQKISIGESRSKKFKIFSRLVEAVEGVGHSHIFISWKDSMGLRWVAEARGGGIRIISNIEFKEVNEVVNIYWYDATENDFEESIKYIWRESVKGYGYLQIVGLLWMRIGNLFSRKILGIKNRFTNPFRDGDFSQICCEFAINTAVICLQRKSPADLENFGLIETRRFNRANGEIVPSELIARINNR